MHSPLVTHGNMTSPVINSPNVYSQQQQLQLIQQQQQQQQLEQTQQQQKLQHLQQHRMPELHQQMLSRQEHTRDFGRSAAQSELRTSTPLAKTTDNLYNSATQNHNMVCIVALFWYL